MAIAILGAGCFWCVEAVFQRVEGVQSVVSGYMGGNAETADYKSVCSGMTDHAEVVQITFDDSIVSFQTLLEVFFEVHDPTTLNRQGNDVGPQYRSVIFPVDDSQAQIAADVIQNAQKQFAEPIVTTIETADTFYSAEAYHQNYYNQNSHQPYCALVISPKLQKLSQ